MIRNTLKIGFAIEPIVKVDCTNQKCLHNLAQIQECFCCNLKYVNLDEDGKCTCFIDRDTYMARRE